MDSIAFCGTSCKLVSIPFIAGPHSWLIYFYLLGQQGTNSSPQEFVAAFSSYGPTLENGQSETTQDVRILPKLVVPGEYQS